MRYSDGNTCSGPIRSINKATRFDALCLLRAQLHLPSVSDKHLLLIYISPATLRLFVTHTFVQRTPSKLPSAVNEDHFSHYTSPYRPYAEQTATIYLIYKNADVLSASLRGCCMNPPPYLTLHSLSPVHFSHPTP